MHIKQSKGYSGQKASKTSRVEDQIKELEQNWA
jgi:hypothetical protein